VCVCVCEVGQLAGECLKECVCCKLALLVLGVNLFCLNEIKNIPRYIYIYIYIYIYQRTYKEADSI